MSSEEQTIKIVHPTKRNQLALKEAELIKDHVKLLVKKLTLQLAFYQITTRDNRNKNCDILFNEFTLAIQLNEPSSFNPAGVPYLLLQ